MQDVSPENGSRVLKRILLWLVLIPAMWGLLSFCVVISTSENVVSLNFKTSFTVDSSLIKNKDVKQEIKRMEREIKQYSSRLWSILPHRPYITVNTVENRFELFDSNGKLLRHGFCSSGSYTKLVGNNGKVWEFKTPKKRMTITAKTVNPVWAKPDWAFIEDGLPVPPAGHPSRFESGVLGKYKLTLADGYLIHGTLYKRFLGMPVTHGCVRLGDEDLKEVYNTLQLGSYVYIY